MIVIVVLGLCINLLLNCDSIENGWKGIKPLNSTKREVEKLLGPPISDKDGFYGYRTPEAFISIEYSATPCTANSGKRGQFSIPQNTVVNYVVTLKEPLKLSDLEFARPKYEKDTGDGHLLNYALYINKVDGISIEVFSKDEIEYVGGIYVKPSVEEDKKLKCKTQT